jgi:hypothetical protein
MASGSGASFVRQMQMALRGKSVTDERLLEIVEQLHARVRRLESLDARWSGVRVSRHVDALVDRMLVGGGA